MSERRLRRLACCLVRGIAAVVLSFPAVLVTAEEWEPAVAEIPVAVPDRAEVAGLITHLDSADYRLRREASRRLAVAGAAAVEPLVHAARNGSLEAKIRAVAVLEEMYTTADEAAVYWVLRHDREDLSPADQAAFAAWLDASDAHAAAFRKASGVWDVFEQSGADPHLTALRQAAQEANAAIADYNRRVGR